jgi:hypothetical protein
VPTWAKNIGVVALMLTLTGVFYGIFLGGFPAIWKAGHASDWSWWQYALAVPALGVFYALAEAAGLVLSTPFTWGGDDQPVWKRAIFRLFVILAICAAIAFALSPLWLATMGNSNAI